MLAILAAALVSCGGGDGDAARSIRLYTSVTADTVEAVVAGFDPDTEVEVFRAPTGELSARIAAELREGGLSADVLWLTDPLSMYVYQADGLLAAWEPANVATVPEDARTGTFFGTRFLNLVMIQRTDIGSLPGDWSELTSGVPDGVAIPDPAFAGSAYAALGYFALTGEYGMDFYRDLAAAGGEQVRAPGDVVTGVAEGRYGAGMTLDRTARDAIEAGSPITMVWPSPGAITIYSPIAVVEGSAHSDAARAFVEHVLGLEAQQAIADTGWQPIRSDVAWPHETGPRVGVDWRQAFERRDELLDEYRSIFGG